MKPVRKEWIAYTRDQPRHRNCCPTLGGVFNIQDIHHRLVAALVAAHSFVEEDIAVVAASAVAEAGCTAAFAAAAAAAELAAAAFAAVAADIAAASAAGEGAGAGRTDSSAAGAEAGCTHLGVWAVPDWMNRCCDFFLRRFVLRNVVAPREPVGFLRGRVLAGRD